MIRPSALKQGDTIGIVAPGRKLDADTINTAVSILESWEVKVELGKNLLSTGHSYLSGTDAERLEDLQNMLDNPSVSAILCARGGYGTTRILDQLDFTSFLKNPKWICGFSDITSLHLKLQLLGVQSIHGTMPVLFSKVESKESIESLMQLLRGNGYTINASVSANNKPGHSTGQLIGGNLSLIVDSLGTSTEIDTEGKILVIEEVDEYLYKIDRMLMQLKRAKKLQHLSGLAIGHMTGIKDTELPFGETIYDIILNHVKEFNFPVAFNFPIGHENLNLAWVHGGMSTLSVTPEESLLN